MDWTGYRRLPRFAHPDGIAFGFLVHRFESLGFLSALGQDQCLPRSGIHDKTLFIFKFAVDLDLDSPALAIADISGDGQPAVGGRAFLEAGTGYRLGGAPIHQHKLGVVFRVKLCHVLRFCNSVFRLTATEKSRESQGQSEEMNVVFHKDCGDLECSLT